MAHLSNLLVLWLTVAASVTATYDHTTAPVKPAPADTITAPYSAHATSTSVASLDEHGAAYADTKTTATTTGNGLAAAAGLAAAGSPPKEYASLHHVPVVQWLAHRRCSPEVSRLPTAANRLQANLAAHRNMQVAHWQHNKAAQNSRGRQYDASPRCL